MVSAGALEGALCVNVLIQQGLRVDTELGPLTTPCVLRPVCVRALSGVCPWLSESRSVSLAANSKPGARWNTTKTKWTKWCWHCSP